MKCFVLGNGGSLRDVNNETLDKLPTFGSNRIYLKYVPTVYACINDLIAEQSRKEISELRSLKFVTSRISPILGCLPLFSTAQSFSLEPQFSIYEGGTVTVVLLQLAFWLGFREVYLLGVDHHYTYKGDPNEEIVWQGKDVNHFDPSYMKDGEKWNCPDLYASEMSYGEAREMFEEVGGGIYNCTEGSKLEIFERRKLEDIWK